MNTGTCLCGGVAFTVTGELSPPSVCHCTQCRKQSGHVWSSTHIPRDRFALMREDTLAWYQSSDKAARGFCATCGSFLFWTHQDEDAISIAMGAFDSPTGAKLSRHIFVADKGDYYDIDDGLPSYPASSS